MLNAKLLAEFRLEHGVSLLAAEAATKTLALALADLEEVAVQVAG